MPSTRNSFESHGIVVDVSTGVIIHRCRDIVETISDDHAHVPLKDIDEGKFLDRLITTKKEYLQRRRLVRRFTSLYDNDSADVQFPKYTFRDRHMRYPEIKS